MKIMVSACLLGNNCKYDGGNNLSDKVLKFVGENEVIPICPEQLGGLPTPRIPAEIVDGIVTNRNGISVDKEFRIGAEKALKVAVEQNIDVAILQSRSPSCGVNQIYDGTFTGNKIKGSGVFAKRLIELGINVIDVENL